MKLKLDVPEIGDTDVIVPGVGLVHNGDMFEVDETVGRELVKDSKFQTVGSELKKGSEK